MTRRPAPHRMKRKDTFSMAHLMGMARQNGLPILLRNRPRWRASVTATRNLFRPAVPLPETKLLLGGGASVGEERVEERFAEVNRLPPGPRPAGARPCARRRHGRPLIDLFASSTK